VDRGVQRLFDEDDQFLECRGGLGGILVPEVLGKRMCSCGRVLGVQYPPPGLPAGWHSLLVLTTYFDSTHVCSSRCPFR
jgi:hypothetical protein